MADLYSLGDTWRYSPNGTIASTAFNLNDPIVRERVTVTVQYDKNNEPYYRATGFGWWGESSLSPQQAISRLCRKTIQEKIDMLAKETIDVGKLTKAFEEQGYV